MRRKGLISLAALPLAAWGIFALTYAISRGTQGGNGPFVIVGVTFTCFAGLLIVLAWIEGEGGQRATVASVLATLVTLSLAALDLMGPCAYTVEVCLAGCASSLLDLSSR